MATNFEPHECVNFVKVTKIGTHENTVIHSIPSSIFELSIFNFILWILKIKKLELSSKIKEGLSTVIHVRRNNKTKRRQTKTHLISSKANLEPLQILHASDFGSSVYCSDAYLS